MAVASSTRYLYGARALGILLMVVAVVTTTYWVLWFIVPGGRDLLAVLPHDHAYLTFENAFPLADEWLALCAAVAGVLLWRRRPVAFIWLFMAGSAGLYLAGMDILYDLENGIYGRISQNPASVITEMVINVATVAFSLITLWWAATRRGAASPTP